MNKLHSLSIKSKLILSFSAMVLCLVVVSAIAMTSINNLSNENEHLGQNNIPSIRHAGELRGNVIDVRVSVLNHLLYQELERMQAEEKALETKTAAVAKSMRAYEPLISLPGEQELFDRFKTEWAAYLEAVQGVLTHSRIGRKDLAQEETTRKVRPRIKVAAQALDDIIVLNNKAGEIVASSDASARSAKNLMLTIGSGAILLAIALATLIVVGVTRGIRSVVEPMKRIASGDLTVEIPHRGARTEIGMIADAVQVFKDGLIRMRSMEEEAASARAGTEAQRKRAMRELADSFEAAVGGIIGLVSSSATELRATAQSMAGLATKTAGQSTTVAAAAQQAATNVGTVATAAEELGSSVQEIGRQVDGSASLAQLAVNEASRSAALVEELSSSVAQIGDVVTMISTIAGQTNLLALNATIEAARAGEAGRGFAVVATEVKELAGQTARATEQISAQIGRIQGSTDQAVASIGSIGDRIQEISRTATAIAAAVEEQGMATQEIVRNVAEAAAGTGEVTGNITGVANAAEETGAAASQVLGAASELSRQSEHLSSEVSRFLATVRAA
ncbi:methyl-accepting chemotaxis protein [Methylorubrum thiocyanatum]|uniref:methyl-accepting chemotaxis protein n=1 Tax=Methylorubrum thiocyanatum TaxID=47958 RepID=UPI00398C39C4